MQYCANPNAIHFRPFVIHPCGVDRHPTDGSLSHVSVVLRLLQLSSINVCWYHSFAILLFLLLRFSIISTVFAFLFCQTHFSHPLCVSCPTVMKNCTIQYTVVRFSFPYSFLVNIIFNSAIFFLCSSVTPYCPVNQSNTYVVST